MVDKTGYVKITDFGLSKENISDNHSAKSFCGTPEYLAPEIIEGKGHGQAVDWWSLGAILFEMLTGMPPFYSKDRDKLFKSIKTGSVKFPKYLSKHAVSLLEALFIKDPDKRLGSGPNGVQEIKDHPFFGTIDWNAILNMKIKPPFIPKIRSETDTRYIDPDFTSCTPVDSLTNGESLGENENPYKDFSYNPPNIGENK
ncbi:MAG: protein kinase [archaeon]|nr:protein kinase [archaeon]